MTRSQALPYVSFVVDDALAILPDDTDLSHAVLVGWQCGFEPLFVAVLGSTVDTNGNRDVVDFDTAAEIAIDLLSERKWFSGEEAEPDYLCGVSRYQRS